MKTGFFSWRWAPAILLVASALAFSLAAVVFIPSTLGALGVTRANTPSVTLKNEQVTPVSYDEASEAPVAEEGLARNRRRASRTTSAATVELFFSRAPETELPPPLPDDPVPPEPANPPKNSDAFGPGVAPSGPDAVRP